MFFEGKKDIYLIADLSHKRQSSCVILGLNSIVSPYFWLKIRGEDRIPRRVLLMWINMDLKFSLEKNPGARNPTKDAAPTRWDQGPKESFEKISCKDDLQKMMEIRWNPNKLLTSFPLEVMGCIEQSLLNENTSTWKSCDYDEKNTNALVKKKVTISWSQLKPWLMFVGCCEFSDLRLVEKWFKMSSVWLSEFF